MSLLIYIQDLFISDAANKTQGIATLLMHVVLESSPYADDNGAVELRGIALEPTEPACLNRTSSQWSSSQHNTVDQHL